MRTLAISKCVLQEAIVDGRFVFVAVLSILGWFLFLPSHRYTNLHHKMRVHRFVAVIAGSRIDSINAEAFAFQLGFLSMVLWDTLLVSHGISNFAYSVLLGSLTILLLQRIFRSYTKKSNEECDR